MTIRAIGELCSWAKGFQVPRDNTDCNKDIAYLHYGDLYKLYDFKLDLDEQYRSIIKIDGDDRIKQDQMLMDGDIVFTLTSETVDDLGYCTLIVNPENKPFVAGMETTVIHVKKRDEILPSYLNYYFQNESFRKELQQFVTGMKVYRVHPKDLMKIKINLPTIEEQSRIVSILDSLSDKIEINAKINDNLGGVIFAS